MCLRIVSLKHKKLEHLFFHFCPLQMWAMITYILPGCTCFWDKKPYKPQREPCGQKRQRLVQQGHLGCPGGLKLYGPMGWLGAQNVSDALLISFCSVLDSWTITADTVLHNMQSTFSFIASLDLLDTLRHYVRAGSPPDSQRRCAPQRAQALAQAYSGEWWIGPELQSLFSNQFSLHVTSTGVFLSLLLRLQILGMRKINHWRKLRIKVVPV